MSTGLSISDEIVAFYKEHAADRGVSEKVAVASLHILDKAFFTCDPGLSIIQVFDSVLLSVYPAAFVKRQVKPETKALDYDSVRRREGWASNSRLRAEASVQAAAVVPSQDFIDWLHDAVIRYYENLRKAEALSAELNSDGPINNFFGAYLVSSQVADEEFEVPERAFGEPLDVFRACAPEPLNRFIEKGYVPSEQHPIDLHMRTSFSNRLRGVDWSYYLQDD